MPQTVTTLLFIQSQPKGIKFNQLTSLVTLKCTNNLNNINGMLTVAICQGRVDYLIGTNVQYSSDHKKLQITRESLIVVDCIKLTQFY